MNTSVNRTKTLLLALAVITLLGGLARAWPIASRPLWFDEADTWRAASANAPDKAIKYRHFFGWTNHFENAPLGYLAARVSMDIFGREDEWIMRLPALIAGILCIPAAYGLGYVARGHALGALTALLVAFDPNMVDQSQQCRMYSMLSLFSIVAMTLTIQLLRDPSAPGRQSGTWRWSALGLMLGLCLWATLLGVMVWVGIAAGVGLLLAGGYALRQRHPRPMAIIVGFTLSFIIAAAVAYQGVYRVIFNLGHPRRPQQIGVLQIAREVVAAANDMINLTPAGLVVFVFAAVGLVLLFRQCKTSAIVIGAMALVNLGLLFMFRKQHHFMDPRYLTVAQGALFVGLAMFALGMERRALRVAAITIVFAYAGLQAWQSTHMEYWWQQPDKYQLAEAIKAVGQGKQPGEAVLYVTHDIKILGDYYGAPVDRELARGVYEVEGNYKLRTDPRVPESFTAPGTWVIVGLANSPIRFDTARPVLELLGEHYHVKPEAIALLERDALKVDHVTKVRFVEGQATYDTLHGARWRKN